MDTTQLLKGVLDLAVLAVVEDDDGYGYDVLRRLRAGGLTEVGDASVYGTLRRLYAAGALTSYVVPSDSGPHRKYYGITPIGRTQLEQQTKDWATFSDTVTALLDHRTLDQTPHQTPHQTQGASS
jgi:PadR family transcriptional regulator PadR